VRSEAQCSCIVCTGLWPALSGRKSSETMSFCSVPIIAFCLVISKQVGCVDSSRLPPFWVSFTKKCSLFWIDVRYSKWWRALFGFRDVKIDLLQLKILCSEYSRKRAPEIVVHALLREGLLKLDYSCSFPKQLSSLTSLTQIQTITFPDNSYWVLSE